MPLAKAAINSGTRYKLDLETFNDRFIDGLKFCGKVYDLYDQIRTEPNGIGKLRLRKSLREKRLIEELLPLAYYVQARYREGGRVKVRWSSGSQQYDAILKLSGKLVTLGFLPETMLVEITRAVHTNDHLARKRLHEQGGSFGPKGTTKNPGTRKIVSEPYVNVENEIEANLAALILSRLKDQRNKNYPPGTVLIIDCASGDLVLKAEWESAVAEVEKANLHEEFREVYLIDLLSRQSATLGW